MGGTAMRGAGDMGAKSRPSPFIQLDHLELAFPVFERLDLEPPPFWTQYAIGII